MEQSFEQHLLDELAELRQAVRELKALQRLGTETALAHARLAAIVESSDDAIVSKTPDGIITTWNAGAERIFGFTSREMVGQSIERIVPDDLRREESEILAKLRRGERVDHFVTVRCANDGRRIDVSMSVSPIRDAEGKIVGASNITRDVSRRTQYEQELSRAKEQAERANAEKDQFIAVLSHELRTPLMPVVAGLALLESGKLTDGDRTAEIATMRRNIQLESQLIDDLLDHTRITSGKIHLKYEMANLHQLITAVVAMCGSEIRAKRLHVQTRLEAGDHFALVDPKRIQQVLWNLLKNAIKFSPKEGRIDIRTWNQQGLDEEPGSVSNGHSDNSISIEIRDQGIGMAPDLLSRIFRPFEQGGQTITRRFGGLGLGLSISKSFVELHHGHLSAQSGGHGTGASFTISLPGAASIAPAAPAGSRSLSPGDVHHFRLLLVEDHADTRRLLARLLGDYGYRVEQAGTVEEAIRILDHAPIDLVVSDVGLPDGTGMQVMEHARRLSDGHGPPKGIAVSGFGTLEDERASRAAGFQMHIAKPVDVDMLAAAIQGLAQAGNRTEASAAP